MSAARPVRAVALVAALIVLLSGCQWSLGLGESHFKPTPDDIIGTWVKEGPNGAIAKLEFAEDGTFVQTGVPALSEDLVDERIKFIVDWDAPEDAHGTWEIGSKWSDQMYYRVRLNYDDRPRLDLSCIEADDVVTINFIIGDPDSAHRFALAKEM